ncbi:MAG: FHA domain-containing protein [Pirellulaceae bacterium]|nr:FHA domain-containing protein [Pirellulaceae bacterium]
MKKLRLIQLNQREVRSIHYLIKPVTSIGRAGSNDIVVNHKQVSRQHVIVRLNLADATATVEDCGSANGAFLNGDRIEEPMPLVDGDTLTVGDIDFGVESVEHQSTEVRPGFESTQFDTHGTLDVDDYVSAEALDEDRNAELDALGLRNSDKDETLDQIAQIAATLFSASAGFVSVAGSETCFYKGSYRLAQREWKRGETPCSLVVEARAPIWIGEMFSDKTLLKSPFLQQPREFRFYAAAPFFGPSGIAIGTVGVASELERSASESQLEALDNLAKFVERYIMLGLEKKRADELHVRLVASEGVGVAGSDDTD